MTPTNPSSTTDTPVRPPKQARSRDTLERIVQASGRLMDRSDFNSVSVSEIASEAGSSVGAFYARFRDKSALLDHLEQLAIDEIDQFADLSDAAVAPGGATIHEAVSRVTAFLVGFHRRRRGILRALALRDRARPEPGERTDLDTRIFDLSNMILRRRGEIAHPSPDQAVHLGFAMMLGALRERVLFGQSGRMPMPESLLVEELSIALVSYLLR